MHKGLRSRMRGWSPFIFLRTNLLLAVFAGRLLEIFSAEFLLEFLNSSGSIDEFLLAGIKRVAS